MLPGALRSRLPPSNVILVAQRAVEEGEWAVVSSRLEEQVEEAAAEM